MRLLVAEDHPSLARSLADGLREEGYAVDLTFDGAEADHMVKSNPYDCVVLDLNLPGKEGLAILRDLRRRKDPTPVLCLTARDAVESRVEGLNTGADDYLTKPFAWEELVARVRALIRRAHDKPDSTIRIADLEIDTPRKSVRRAGHEILLSAREYALLQYLALREGHVVSRTDIWEHLYDQHDESSSNVVDVYIGYLRNKVDKPYPRKLIHTRRGQGYVLTAESDEATAPD